MTQFVCDDLFVSLGSKSQALYLPINCTRSAAYPRAAAKTTSAAHFRGARLGYNLAHPRLIGTLWLPSGAIWFANSFSLQYTVSSGV